MTQGGAEALTPFISRGDVSDTVFHQMIDALPVAIYMTDAEGRLTYFNPAAVKLSGHTPEVGTDSWCFFSKIFLADGTPLPV